MLGYKGIVEAVARDLERRLPKQRATQRHKLSELVGGMLICQTPNLMGLSNVFDRPTESAEARYNYVERFLKNLKTLFGYRKAKYTGWIKNQVHLDLLAIAYNLKRSSRLARG